MPNPRREGKLKFLVRLGESYNRDIGPTVAHGIESIPQFDPMDTRPGVLPTWHLQFPSAPAAASDWVSLTHYRLRAPGNSLPAFPVHLVNLHPHQPPRPDHLSGVEDSLAHQES